MNREEILVKKLPEVPAEENAIDKEIEERLLKLKFFRRAWITDEASACETPQPEVKIAVQADIHSEPKIIVASVDKTPDFKTKNESQVKLAPDVISKNVAEDTDYTRRNEIFQ